MEVDFDKQIDSIMRDLANDIRLSEPVQNLHLEADEISVFAENAMPNEARLRAIEHLADCSRCRKILADVSLLNLQPINEIVHENLVPLSVIPAFSWYKKFFVFPQMAYTFGTLALLLCGLFGFILWQQSNKNETSVAQLEKNQEQQTVAGGPRAASDLSNDNLPIFAANTTANSSVVANSAANISSTTTGSIGLVKPQATINAANVAVISDNRAEADKIIKESMPAEKPPAPIPADEKSINKDVTGTGVSESPAGVATSTADVAINQKQIPDLSVQSRNNSQIVMPDGSNQTRNAPALPAPAKKTDEDGVFAGKYETKSAKSKAPESVATKTIGGKTFKNINGIWIDSTYTGGLPKTIAKGSDEYKKLDPGLQAIGNSIGGTAVIVWAGKNYRLR